jgi:putative transposase
LQDVLARLDKTYQAFFRRLADGEKPGFPRFQGANRYHSFTYKEYGNGAQLDNGYLVLSKIGRLAVRWSRPVEGSIKTVTISKEADGWYVCFSCAEVPTQPLPPTGRETGIDVGLKVFLITADGEIVENPRHYRKAERELKQAQKRVSRRKTGSKRRRKAVRLCAKKHQHVRRQRTDFGSCPLCVKQSLRSCHCGPIEHPLAQQVEVGASVHTALEQLESGDLSLDLSLAPGQRETRLHGGAIPPDAEGEAF